jgi:hypothetical protein
MNRDRLNLQMRYDLHRAQQALGAKINSFPMGYNLRGEILMRILALAALTMATAFPAPSARAQTYDPAYPVCLQIYQGFNDYYFECGYTSLAQCNMSASGRAAQCIVNPYYAGAKTAPLRPRKPARKPAPPPS